MSDDAKKALSDLRSELEQHESSKTPRGQELSEVVRSAMDDDEPEGLGDKLTEAAVHFEVEHPDIAAVIRRTVQLMADSGL
jgi:hypothetical protein